MPRLDSGRRSCRSEAQAGLARLEPGQSSGPGDATRTPSEAGAIHAQTICVRLPRPARVQRMTPGPRSTFPVCTTRASYGGSSRSHAHLVHAARTAHCGRPGAPITLPICSPPSPSGCGPWVVGIHFCPAVPTPRTPRRPSLHRRDHHSTVAVTSPLPGWAGSSVGSGMRRPVRHVGDGSVVGHRLGRRVPSGPMLVRRHVLGLGCLVRTDVAAAQRSFRAVARPRPRPRSSSTETPAPLSERPPRSRHERRLGVVAVASSRTRVSRTRVAIRRRRLEIQLYRRR